MKVKVHFQVLTGQVLTQVLSVRTSDREVAEFMVRKHYSKSPVKIVKIDYIK